MLSTRQIIICMLLVAALLAAVNDLVAQFEQVENASTIRKIADVLCIIAAAAGIFHFGRARCRS